MSEQKSEIISTAAGSGGTSSIADAMSLPGEPTSASLEAPTEVESPRLSPEQEDTSPRADAPQASKIEAPTPKVEAPGVEATKTEPTRTPGKVLIMSPRDRASNGTVPGAGAGKRRLPAIAAVVVLAMIAGALGGALATAGFERFFGGEKMAANNSSLEAAVARIDADILTLKASVEHDAGMAAGQFNKTSDRLDKIEKAQAEPAAKIAKLSEAVDKLRAAPVVAATVAVPAAARDVTGSIAPPATVATVPAASAKPDIARLPTVEGWVLRDVGNGGALIESRRGIFEVYAGDPVPGLGRVDAIRKQDGRWVVVTSKGLIVAR